MAVELIEGDDFIKELEAYAAELQRTIPDVNDAAKARQAAVICVAIMAIHEKATALRAIFNRAHRKHKLKAGMPVDVAELRPFSAWTPRGSWGLN